MILNDILNDEDKLKKVYKDGNTEWKLLSIKSNFSYMINSYYLIFKQINGKKKLTIFGGEKDINSILKRFIYI